MFILRSKIHYKYILFAKDCQYSLLLLILRYVYKYF